jgi:hypothetical protein
MKPLAEKPPSCEAFVAVSAIAALRLRAAYGVDAIS